MDLQKYKGNKAIDGVYHKIINNIPKHSVYMELFAGGAAIARILYQVGAMAPECVLNDLDTDVTKALAAEFQLATVKNENAIEIIAAILSDQNFCHDKFAFLDPPYKLETRPNSPILYDNEMDDEDHVKLLYTILEAKFPIMVIHPKCELYDTMLNDWRQIEIKIRYHNKTSIEILYMNYPEDLPLQCYNFLGKNWMDRQRIRRKGERLLKKITGLPKDEQNYLLNALQSLHKTDPE